MQRTGTIVSVKNIDILIPNDKIIEIYKPKHITPVPNAATAIIGAMNFRGEIISILDLSKILKIKEDYQELQIDENSKKNSNLLIVEYAKHILALSVDEIKTIQNIDNSKVYFSCTINKDEDSSYFFNGALINNSNEIILILNVEHLFQKSLIDANLTGLKSEIVFFDLSTQYLKSQDNLSYKTTLKENNLLLFKLREIYCTFPSISIIQLAKLQNITPTSNSAPYVIGLTSFRGDILPVIDLQIFFYGEKSDKNIGELTDNFSYIAIEHEKNRVIFRVETISGNIGSPNEDLLSTFPNILSSIEYNYFESGFIRESNIIIQLNLEAILSEIKKELEHYQRDFVSENKILLSPINLPESLETLNINLQEKLTSHIPTFTNVTSKKQKFKMIKTKKHTGVLIKTKNLEVIIPNDQVIEIFTISSLTKVPNASPAVIGAINFRGNVISVLDLSLVLGLSSSHSPSSFKYSEKIIIFEIEEEQFALYVGELIDIVDIDEKSFHPVISDEYLRLSGYYFKGAIINSSGGITLILDINYLLQHCSNPDFFAQKVNQIILFSNPERESDTTSQISDKQGILFKVDDYYYFIPSMNVVQILEKNALIRKDYSHDAIIGASVHTSILPLIDFRTIFNTQISKDMKNDNKCSIVITDPETGIELSFLVDEITEEINTRDFESYRKDLKISEKIIPKVISGFFSYDGILGMEINPKMLIKESSELVKQNLSLTNIKNEFVSTLSQEERDYLETFYETRRELELLLFYQQKGHRNDFFVFKWGEIFISLDVNLVKRVFNSSDISLTFSEIELSPFIGTSNIDKTTVPIIDLASQVLSTGNKKQLLEFPFLFLINHQSKSYFVPADNIEGIIPKFDEELKPNEDKDLFIQKDDVCKNIFQQDEISEKIYIIENEYLNKIFNSKRLTTNLKNLLGKKLKS